MREIHQANAELVRQAGTTKDVALQFALTNHPSAMVTRALRNNPYVAPYVLEVLAEKVFAITEATKDAAKSAIK